MKVPPIILGGRNEADPHELFYAFSSSIGGLPGTFLGELEDGVA
jgi:hypothetical protein